MDILATLFSELLVPNAVYNELLAFHLSVPDFLKVASVQRTEAVDKLCLVVDLGEAEAIILAMEQSANLLLIDDAAARNFAISKGLPVSGLLGVLVKAKQFGFISALTPLLSDLETIAGFRISAQLKAAVLQTVGE